MAKRKYDTATKPEMEKFVEQLSYWSSQHPINCSNCQNISQCTHSPICKSLTLNFSENTCSKLSAELSYQPSAKTIRDYYREWESDKKAIKKTAVVLGLFSYLENFKNNPYSDDKKLIEYKVKLKEHYNAFQLKVGCDLSEKAIKQYPFQIDIIRWWSLFHNRKMKWNLVRETLLKKISDTDDDNIVAECYLGIFESCLNEYTKDRHRANAFKELQDGKAKYLDSVPNKETNGKYYYFVTRFMEEEWWLLPDEHAKSASTIIFHAIASINKSIDLYQKDESGYTSIDNKPWWLYCHKALLLKIWQHEEFSKTLIQYGELILNEIEINPNRKSTQMYAITYYILCDDLEKLSSFLQKLDGILDKSEKPDSISIEDNRITTVDNLTYRYTELIFYNDVEKQKKYQKVITTWFQRNTH